MRHSLSLDLVRRPALRPNIRSGAVSGIFCGALVGALVGLLVACDEPLADDPAIDPEAPVVRITSPERAAYLGDVSTVTVSGAVFDESPLASLTINGEPALLAEGGAFSATLPISPTGTTLFTVEAIDRDGNVGRETRAFSAGPQLVTGLVHRDAVTAAISDSAFLAIGNATARILVQSDLGAWIAPFNPVLSAGSPDGPDCLFGDVSVGALDVGAAQIELYPTAAGLTLVAELSAVKVPMHLRFALLCADGHSEAAMTADKVRITGRFTAAIKDGRFDLKLVEPRATFEGFHLALPGLPPEVEELLDLDTALGPVLSWAVEALAAPLLGEALAGLDGDTSLPILDKTLALEVSPAEITFSPVDAVVRLDTRFRFAEDQGGRFVAAANTAPRMDAGDGLRLAVADDAVNSLLAGFWSAGGMEVSLDLTTGDYGGLGTLYDRVEISGRLPLAVRADRGAATVVLPELLASFKKDDAVVTQIALNGEIDLAVAQGGDGALRLGTGTPRVFVDILQEGVAGGNPLARSQLEVLASFAVARLAGVATGLIGAVPLPSGPGLSLIDVTARGDGGYVTIEGDTAE
jgi:Glucodextranase, domain B